MTIDEILNSGGTAAQIIAALKEKTISVPMWGGRRGLVMEFDPTKHPVMNKAKYPDIVNDDGVEYVTRITCDMQRLATKRMTELVCGIPVRRVYKPENDRQKEIAGYMEKIYERNRIDSVNIERCNMLFAGCEVMTLWYAVEQSNSLYGFQSKLKFRCRNFSPMLGDDLYPLFDEYGDLIALSVGYTRKSGRKIVQYFDTYTAAKHIKWSTTNGDWEEVENEDITLGKIPAVYAFRPTPIWEDTSRIVFEIEWALSRNGNYLRKNSKPVFVVFADEQINYGDEQDENREFRSIMQYPKGSTAQYITWAQAVENLKFYVTELRQSFFTQLQLPDWSYESMKASPMSGESRKQLFIDAQLKVRDESGRLLEFFDRESNVVKAFLKVALGSSYEADIDALPVKNEITAYTITDEKDTITNLTTANGGKPLISHRESIEMYGHSTDVDKTMQEIAEEEAASAFGPTL
ncbi:phage portal protein [Alistipes sp.]|uniref:phage portal protein n=1 Tax=Alistipes sp. TaxID=1872444 RepID=UPI0025C07410|nr:phage portal protein [Alistipes sp.]